MQDTRRREITERQFESLIFISSELVIFAMFYLMQVDAIFYYLYLSVTPLLFVVISYSLPEIRNAVSATLLSKDFMILISVLLFWLYLYALTRNGPVYVFETAYYPVFLEEFNFRFLIIMFLQRRFPIGQAIIIQAVLYSLLYLSFILFQGPGYPGIFAELFMIDNFAMAVTYGAIYYFRKNFYIAAAVHMSLYLMDVFLPPSLGWIAYVTTPV